MTDKYIMTQWQKFFNILATSRSCGNVHCPYQHYQQGQIILHVSVLITEYLVSTSHELWMM